MSIPYRPRKSNGDVGPCYYSPTTTSDSKVRCSASKVGSSCMSSSVDRFPLRHPQWGMPEPGKYEPLQALHNLNNTSLARNARVYSSTFYTTSRDDYFYNMSFSTTPGPGTYSLDSTIRYNQLLQAQRKYQKLKEKAQVYSLIQEAARAQKSLARYYIENDENFIPPKPAMQEETLPERPFCVKPEAKPKSNGLERVANSMKVYYLKQKYRIATQYPEKLLASEIYTEIDETARHYQEMNGKPEVQLSIRQSELRDLVQRHLRKVGFENQGLAFGTRKTSQMVDEVRIAEEEQLALLGPGRYETSLLEEGKRGIYIYKQLGRQENFVNDGVKSYYVVGKESVPPVGAYDVREPKPKSFLLNEDAKWV